MDVNYKAFPSIIEDNLLIYFGYLEGAVEQVDFAASLEVTNLLNGINVRIAPSEAILIPQLIKQMEKLHNTLNTRVEFSKSMKSGINVNFQIKFGAN